MRIETDEIARTAHEINRAYTQGIGETPQPAWEDAPAWMRASAIAGVQAITSGEVKSPEEAHMAWMQLKLAEGWTYGAVKDATDKTHPYLKPYDELTAEQKMKDTLFFATVEALLKP